MLDANNYRQCIAEHWTEKIAAQQHEGCNVEGRVRVNKVTGNMQFSPGRSFIVNKPEVYALVPYLKDSNHFFGHFIHSLEIYDYDEDTWTRTHLPPHLRERLGMTKNPLDDVYAHVRVSKHNSSDAHKILDRYSRLHVPIFP